MPHDQPDHQDHQGQPAAGSEELLPKLILIGNSNVGKSSITAFLVKGVHKFVGKVGKHPGTTLRIKPVRMPQGYEIVDLPGFGFMQGTGRDRTQEIWGRIVKFVEENAPLIRAALIIVSLENFRRNVEKWEAVQVPLDVEMAQFLREMGVPVKVVANKVDKLLPASVQEDLAFLAEKMAVPPADIFPTSAKLGKGLKAVKDYVASIFAAESQEAGESG